MHGCIIFHFQPRHCRWNNKRELLRVLPLGLQKQQLASIWWPKGIFFWNFFVKVVKRCQMHHPKKERLFIMLLWSVVWDVSSQQSLYEYTQYLHTKRRLPAYIFCVVSHICMSSSISWIDCINQYTKGIPEYNHNLHHIPQTKNTTLLLQRPWANNGNNLEEMHWRNNFPKGP